MPFDKSNKYHMNPERAKHADRSMGGSMSPPQDKMEKGTSGEMSSSMTQHDDGSCSTDDGDGQSMQHGSAKEALAHMAEKHGHSALADHIMAHDDGQDGADTTQDMPMPKHGGHMMAGL